MNNFSRSTFDKLKHYVSVRLQQGVPIVDADWNETEDIRKFELRAFLKWFVGDGVPAGEDGFHIVPTPAETANDFVIEAGRCLVEGWEVINEADVSYSAQKLPDGSKLPDLKPPAADGESRTDTVYLDVWEREVGALEDNELVDPRIGIETCVRLKREWVVQVAEGADSPPEQTPEGHSYYALAHLTRVPGENSITEIDDLRRKGVRVRSDEEIRELAVEVTAAAVGPVKTDLIQTQQDLRNQASALDATRRDLQNVTTDLQQAKAKLDEVEADAFALDPDGPSNLKISLRSAINALLRGEVPSTPESSLTIDRFGEECHFVLEDRKGTVWVFWQGFRVGTLNDYDIWYKRYHGGIGEPEKPLTAGSETNYTPFALEDREGNIWVFWASGASDNGQFKICFTRGHDDDWQAPSPITDTVAYRSPAAFEDLTGTVWVFYWSAQSGNDEIWCRHYSNGAWAEETQISRNPAGPLHPKYPDRPAILQDRGETIWVFWTRIGLSNPIWFRFYTFSTQTWSDVQPLTSDVGSYYEPTALMDREGSLWVFWRSNRSKTFDIWYKRYRSGSWSDDTQLTNDMGLNASATVLEDREGTIWAFWTSSKSGNYDIWYKRYSGGQWGVATQLTHDPAPDDSPVVLQDKAGDIWVFWRSFRGKSKVWYKKLVLSL